MASLKEIKNKVDSIKSTQKITRAMQMVAVSKMRRAQERMEAGRPYTQNIRRVCAHMARAAGEYEHPYLAARPVKRVGYLVVSSDRGLAGGLNINLFKTLVRDLGSKHSQGVEAVFCVLGQKGVSFFRNFGGKVVSVKENYGDNPSAEEVSAPLFTLLEEYKAGRIDEIYLVYNRFVNAMTQLPKVTQLVPIHTDAFSGEFEDETEDRLGYWDYIYEPDPQVLIDALMSRYIEALVYQAILENIASEQAARMVAMKAATDNAGGLIDDLQLEYNKLRQAAITQEISEIVGGAAAVS